METPSLGVHSRFARGVRKSNRPPNENPENTHPFLKTACRRPSPNAGAPSSTRLLERSGVLQLQAPARPLRATPENRHRLPETRISKFSGKDADEARPASAETASRLDRPAGKSLRVCRFLEFFGVTKPRRVGRPSGKSERRVFSGESASEARVLLEVVWNSFVGFAASERSGSFFDFWCQCKILFTVCLP